MNPIWKLKNRLMERSRARKCRHFFSLCGPEDRVLDVGVSHDRDPNCSMNNYFLKHFRHDRRNYTGLGVEDIGYLADHFPGARFLQYDGERFPFEDQSFDWLYCNAVIEHVGDRERQYAFLSEMKRVSRNVFFTTPNKRFPVEMHTNAFLRHWFDEHFYRWCAAHDPRFDSTNLNLLSGGDLRSLLRRAGIGSYSMFKNRLLGYPATFTVVFGAG